MNRRRITIVVSAIVLIVITLIVIHKDPMEKFVDQAVEAFEQEDRAGVHNLISDVYLSRYGWDRSRIDESLIKLFAMFNEFSVIIDNISTERITEREGRVTFECRVVATMVQGVKADGDIDLNIYGNQRYYLVGAPPSTSGKISFLCAREDDTWRMVDIIEADIGYPIPHQ